MTKPKILVLDIEISPTKAYVWKMWKENISAKQVIENFYIMSFAAKWFGEDEIIYEDSRTEDDRQITEKLCYYMDQADFIVAHNGENFDIPKIRARAAVHNIPPPSPAKMIDTLKIARREFGFPSNSLESLCNILGLKTKKGQQRKFSGFSLWAECIAGNDEAWEDMRLYNIDDILALEELYLRLRAYDTRHPNLAVYAEDNDNILCPKCGGSHVQWRGYAYTGIGKYHRFQCTDCGGWGRGRYSLLPKNANLIANQAV